jgi:Tfp pilus assembly protein FimT
MIRKVPGVRPSFSNTSIPRGRGFSLVEVLIMITLIGISMALAIPSYRDMVEKRQITNGAEQLASFINTAQGVAQKTNQVVTVSWSHTDAGTWCIGAVADVMPCDCSVSVGDVDYCEIDSQEFVLNNSHTGNLDLMHAMTGSEDGAYAFDPVRGIFTDLSDSLALELRSPNEDFRLNLMVNNTGRVTLCSKDSSHAIPGYELCPVDGGDVVVTDPEEPPVIGIGF